MDNPILLSRSIPRMSPKGHARMASRSPTRPRITDDILADLSPATTLDAFTAVSGTLKASIETASPTQRAFGMRAAIASKKIQEWAAELSAWPWPGQGSEGFEIPPSKRRRISYSIGGGGDGSADLEQHGGVEEYWGSLPARDVTSYENRVGEISDDMEDLDVEEIKRQVLDTHVLPRSRPSSSLEHHPVQSSFPLYTRMDDFTAVITATVLQALPSLSRLTALMDIWTIRLVILRQIPTLLTSMTDAEVALKSGWKAIGALGEEDGRQQQQERDSNTSFLSDTSVLSRNEFEIMRDVLQDKVSVLGRRLDRMLDTLEGRQDTLPDTWLDRMEAIEGDYGEWVVRGERRVRECAWAREIALRRTREETPVRDVGEGVEGHGLDEERERETEREIMIPDPDVDKDTEAEVASAIAPKSPHEAASPIAPLSILPDPLLTSQEAHPEAPPRPSSSLDHSEEAGVLAHPATHTDSRVDARAEGHREEAATEAKSPTPTPSLPSSSKVSLPDISDDHTPNQILRPESPLESPRESPSESHDEVYAPTAVLSSKSDGLVDVKKHRSNDLGDVKQHQPNDLRPVKQHQHDDTDRGTVDLSLMSDGAFDDGAYDAVNNAPFGNGGVGGESGGSERPGRSERSERSGRSGWSGLLGRSGRSGKHRGSRRSRASLGYVRDAEDVGDVGDVGEGTGEGTGEEKLLAKEQETVVPRETMTPETMTPETMAPETVAEQESPPLADPTDLMPVGEGAGGTAVEEEVQDGEQLRLSLPPSPISPLAEVKEHAEEPASHITAIKTLDERSATPVIEDRPAPARLEPLIAGLSTADTPVTMASVEDVPDYSDVKEDVRNPTRTNGSLDELPRFEPEQERPPKIDWPATLASSASVHDSSTTIQADDDLATKNNETIKPLEHSVITTSPTPPVEDAPRHLEHEPEKSSTTDTPATIPAAESTSDHTNGDDGSLITVNEVPEPFESHDITSSPTDGMSSGNSAIPEIKDQRIPSTSLTPERPISVGRNIKSDQPSYSPPSFSGFKLHLPSPPRISEVIQPAENTYLGEMSDKPNKSHSRIPSNVSAISSYSASQPSPELFQAEPKEYFRPVSPPVIFHADLPDRSRNSTPTRPSSGLPDISPTNVQPQRVIQTSPGRQFVRESPRLVISPADRPSGADQAQDESQSTKSDFKMMDTSSKTGPAFGNSTEGSIQATMEYDSPLMRGVSSGPSPAISDAPSSVTSTPVRISFNDSTADFSSPITTKESTIFPQDYEEVSPTVDRHKSTTEANYSPPGSPLAGLNIAKRRPLQLHTTPSFDPDSMFADSPITPGEPPLLSNVEVSPAPALFNPSKTSDDQLQQQISEILESIPAKIRLTSEPDTGRTSGIPQVKKRKSLNPIPRPMSRAPTPSFTLAPAYAKNPRPRPQNGNPEIKLYHLSRSTGEAPIKLFVRLVGENGERVMVRVGGGWADLGEYLKEYASHHGRRSDKVGTVEIQDLPPRSVSGTSTASVATLRNGANGRSSPTSRPTSSLDYTQPRPLSSLAVRKTRKSIGEESRTSPFPSPSSAAALRSPSTPLSAHHAFLRTTPHSSSPASPFMTRPSESQLETPPSATSSARSWTEDDGAALGLAGPKGRRLEISKENAMWVESMKERVRLASVEKERRGGGGGGGGGGRAGMRSREGLRDRDGEMEREILAEEFGEMGKVGAVKRVFKRG